MLGVARSHRAITFMMMTIFITIMAAQDWIKRVEAAVSGSVSGTRKLTGGLAETGVGATAAPIDPSTTPVPTSSSGMGKGHPVR